MSLVDFFVLKEKNNKFKLWFSFCRSAKKLLEMNSTGTNQSSGFDPTFFIDGIKAILAINVVVGLPANIYVLWLIVAGRAVASEVFALNLAVSEIFFCCSSFYTLFHFSLQMSLVIGVLLLQFFLQLMLISRPLFQTCICLERFLAVVHPTLFLR